MTTEIIPQDHVLKPIEKNEIVPSQSSKHCANCKVELVGPFCSKCGQSERSVILFFGSVIMHILEDIFGFDSRVGRTLFPLLFRPGFLTNEYIRGRRVHYVAPLRLYFFISIVFFIMLGFLADESAKDLLKLQQDNTVVFNETSKKVIELESKMSEEGYIFDVIDKSELDKLLAEQLAAEGNLKQSMDDLQLEIDKIEAKERDADYVHEPGERVKKAVFKRSVEEMRNDLQTINTKRALIKPASNIEFIDNKKRLLTPEIVLPPTTNKGRDGKENGRLRSEPDMEVRQSSNTQTIDFGGDYDWLSAEQNQRLKKYGEELTKKAQRSFNNDARPLVKQVLDVLPQIMFLLLPIFAVLLKIIYLFSKRFYVEHLTVALHSHAFIFIVLILTTLLSSLHDTLNADYETLAASIEYLAGALIVWVPLYLFIMQKRVYNQSYFFTGFKFIIIGVSYFTLLGFATVIAFIWGLASL